MPRVALTDRAEDDREGGVHALVVELGLGLGLGFGLGFGFGLG